MNERWEQHEADEALGLAEAERERMEGEIYADPDNPGAFPAHAQAREHFLAAIVGMGKALRQIGTPEAVEALALAHPLIVAGVMWSQMEPAEPVA